MLGMILLCALAAAGLLTVLWAAFGWMAAPFGKSGAVVVLPIRTEQELERELRAWSWLQKTGMTAAALLVLPTEPLRGITHSRCRSMPEVRLCSAEDLPQYIEMELETCSSRS